MGGHPRQGHERWSHRRAQRDNRKQRLEVWLHRMSTTQEQRRSQGVRTWRRIQKLRKRSHREVHSLRRLGRSPPGQGFDARKIGIPDLPTSKSSDFGRGVPDWLTVFVFIVSVKVTNKIQL